MRAAQFSHFANFSEKRLAKQTSTAIRTRQIGAPERVLRFAISQRADGVVICFAGLRQEIAVNELCLISSENWSSSV